MSTGPLWVVIADRERARVLTATRAARAFGDADRLDFHTTYQLNAAQAHRFQPLFGTAMGYRTDQPAGHAPPPFPAWLAHWLNDAARLPAFTRLVLVAPPPLLQELRAALDTHTASLVLHTLAKDLTHVQDHAIAAHIAAPSLAHAVE